eukprot:Rmarinus@m.12078
MSNNIPCRFWTSSGNCVYGDQCTFSHTAPSPADKSRYRGQDIHGVPRPVPGNPYADGVGAAVPGRYFVSPRQDGPDPARQITPQQAPSPNMRQPGPSMRPSVQAPPFSPAHARPGGHPAMSPNNQMMHSMGPHADTRHVHNNFMMPNNQGGVGPGGLMGVNV